MKNFVQLPCILENLVRFLCILWKLGKRSDNPWQKILAKAVPSKFLLKIDRQFFHVLSFQKVPYFRFLFES